MHSELNMSVVSRRGWHLRSRHWTACCTGRYTRLSYLLSLL